MSTAAQTVKRWELNRVRNPHENPPGVLVSAEDYTALERRVTWQPIETAPKDWSPVLLCAGGEVCEGYYSCEDGGDDCWYRANANGASDDAQLDPSAWMPLPAPPDAGGAR